MPFNNSAAGRQGQACTGSQSVLDSIEFWQSELNGFEGLQYPPLLDEQEQDSLPRVCRHQMADEWAAPAGNSKDVGLQSITVLYAAWALLLGKYNMSSDVVFGVQAVPNSSASSPARLLPLRLQWTRSTIVAEFIADVHRKKLLLELNSQLQPAEILTISYDASTACGFRSAVTLSAPEPAAALSAGAEVSSAHTHPQHHAMLGLAISYCSDTNRLKLTSLCATIDAGQLFNLTQQLAHVAQQLGNPEAQELTVSNLNFLCVNDQNQILRWNAVAPPSHEGTVHEYFSRWARDTPNAVAVLSWDGSLTYAELDDLSMRLAGHIVGALGARPGQIVPLCFEKSKWAIVSMLAVLRAGCACANISANQPPERRRRIAELCRAELLLTSPLQTANAPPETLPSTCHVAIVDEALFRDACLPKIAFATALPRVVSDDVAHVFFTSGSTGDPKGIVIEHGSLVTSAMAHGSKWSMEPGTRVLQFASYSFDVSSSDICFSLMRGACICMPSEEQRINNLAATSAQMKVEWANITPSVADLLRPADVPTLRTVLLGGETPTKSNLSVWADSVDLHNVFGSAEVSAFCMGGKLESATSDATNMGRGVGGRLWITDVDGDDARSLAPIGCTGELLVEGRLVARGYLRDSERTAKSFLIEPSWLPAQQHELQASAEGSNAEAPWQLRRVYRTGDLVRYNPNGTISFVGRRDTQVKIAGQRVELGEIEEKVLSAFPEVYRAVACVNAASASDLENYGRQIVHRLVLYLQFTASPMAKQGSQQADDLPETIDAARAAQLIQIHQELELALPSYMVPTLYIPLGKVPLNLSGKVDRRRLKGILDSLSSDQMAASALIDMSTASAQHSAPVPVAVERLVEGELLPSTGLAPSGDINMQPWPSQPSASSGTYGEVNVAMPAVETRAPKGIDLFHVVEGAFALALSAFCGLQVVGYGMHPQAQGFGTVGDSKTRPGILMLATDVDREYPVLQFLRSREARWSMKDALHVNGDSAAIYGANGITPSTVLVLGSSSTSLHTSVLLQSLAQETSARLLIACEIAEDGSSFTTRATYDEGSLSAKEAERFLSLLQGVTLRMCRAGPEDCLGEVSLLGPKEKAEVIEFSGSPGLPVRDVIFRRFVESAQAHAGKISIEAWDGTLSYTELQTLSEHLAAQLHALGVAPGDLVPICIHKSYWYAVAILAVLRLGAAFVPLDPSNPMPRLRRIVDQTAAKIVLTSSDMRSAWAASECATTSKSSVGPMTLALDSCTDAACMPLPPIPMDDESLAYIIFTSGSTGTPKGVEVGHGSYLSGVAARASLIQRDAESRVFQFSSHAFDTSIEDILTTLLVGGTVCVPSEEQRQADVEGAITHYQANVADLTPALVKALSPCLTPTLKTLILGGEAMSPDIVEAWSPHVALINTYGPSECAIVGTVTAPLTTSSNYMDIGRACACRTWVVDLYSGAQLMPLGAPGELIIEGPIVGRGYLHDQAKTAAAFMTSLACVPQRDASSHVSARRAYKTGDVVRVTDRGEIEFIRRKDNMVKLHGQRVELGDIEMHAAALFHVTDIAVEVLADDELSHLALFFRSVGAPAATVDADEDAGDLLRLRQDEVAECRRLKQALSEKLPAYMIPGFFVPLVRMPATVSAKLDRTALRRIGHRAVKEDVQHYKLAPQTASAELPVTELSETGSKVRAAWAKVLKLAEDSLNQDSHFLMVGGDSIRAMRLAALLKRAGLAISVPDIFRFPVLDQMAAKIEGAAQENRSCSTGQFQDNPSGKIDNTEAEPLPFSLIRNAAAIQERCVANGVCGPGAVADILPCTPFQEAALMASAKQPGAYTMRTVFRLDAGTDLARLRAAWNAAIAAFPILRTIIVLSDEQEPVQIVLRDVAVWQTSGGGIAEYLASDETKCMGYGTSLLRLCVVRDKDAAAESATALIMTIHHALYDASSLGCILKQITKLYQEPGNSITSGPSFSNFIRTLQSMDVKQAQHYWERQLSGDPCPNLTVDVAPIVGEARVKSQETRRRQRVIETSLAVLTAPPPASRRPASPSDGAGAGATTAIRARAAWALTMCCFAGTDDVVFDVASMGRGLDIGGTVDVAGPTMATFPVRVKVAGSSGMTTGALMQQMQRQATDTMAYEHFGLSKMRKINATACSSQVIFVVQSSERPTDSDLDSDLDSDPDEAELEPASPALLVPEDVRSSEAFYIDKIVIEVHISQSKQSVDIAATFCEPAVQEWYIRSVLDTFAHVLGQLLTSRLDLPLSELLYCSPQSLEQVRSWNAASALPRGPAPLTDCELAHHVIQRRRDADPDATAIHAWDGQLTYAQLDDQSTRLAAHLQKLLGSLRASAAPTVIPLCFDKSRFMVVSVLAVLKAGYAYAALDASNPDKRLLEMCQQLDAPVALCGTPQAQAGRLAAAEPDMQVVTVNNELMTSLEPVDATSAGHLAEVALNPEHEASRSAAFVVFTSGSTGRPKPIVISHAALCASAQEFGPRMCMSSSSRVLQNTAFAFDIHACEIFYTLMFGGTLFISDQDRSRLEETVAEWNVNTFFTTPSATEAISNTDHPPLPSVRNLIMIGEMPTREQIARFRNRSRRLINAYGPAENTLFSTMRIIADKHDDPHWIGTSINTRVWITHPDHANRLMPVGAVGELLLQGPQLADGYLYRPEETAQAFIPRPAWATHGSDSNGSNSSKLYRTGDLVRYLADGSLAIVGRIGTQVKLRGQRIELGEVEHHLRRALEQRDGRSQEGFGVAVDAITTPEGRQVLAAVVSLGRSSPGSQGTRQQDPTALTEPVERIVMSQAARCTLTDASTALTSRLPRFMVPSVYVPVLTLPNTLSGKLDRKALRALLSSLSSADIRDLALQEQQGRKGPEPQTPEQILLRDLWAPLLNMPAADIGLDDDFISLGGDSILAIKLASSLAQTFSHRSHKRRLAVSDVLAKPRLREMAACLAEDAGSSVSVITQVKPFALAAQGYQDTRQLLQHVSGALHVNAADIQDVYPCTAIQEGLFFMSTQSQGAYVARQSFRLPRDVDKQRLRQAWSQAVSTLDILRTTIATGPAGRLLQVVVNRSTASGVSKSLNTNNLILDLDLDLDTSPAHAACRRPLEVAPGRMLHTAYLEESPGLDRDEGVVFVWEASHALFDAWSMRLLLSYVESQYFGKEPAPVTAYSCFVGYVAAADKEVSRSFWTAKLSGGRAFDFPPELHDGPLDRAGQRKLQPQPARKTFAGSYSLPHLPNAGVSVATVLEAAWAFLLAESHASQEVVYAMTLSGRDAPMDSIDSVVGPTICTIPKRVRLTTWSSISELLEQVRSANLASIPHQHLGFQNIMRLFPGDDAWKPRSILVIQTQQQQLHHHQQQQQQQQQQQKQQQQPSRLFEEMGTAPSAEYNTYPLTVELTVTSPMSASRSKPVEVDVECSFDSAALSELEMANFMSQLFSIAQQMIGDPVGTLNDIRDSLSAGANVGIDSSASASDDGSGLDEASGVSLDASSDVSFSNLSSISLSLRSALGDALLRGGDQVAVRDKSGAMTYSELRAAVSSLSAHLQASGYCRPHSPTVAVCLRPSQWSIVAIMSTLLAGATCCILNPQDGVASHLETIKAAGAGVVMSEVSSALLFRPHLDVLVVNEAVLASLSKLQPLAPSDMTSPFTSPTASHTALQFAAQPSTGSNKVTDAPEPEPVLSVSHLELDAWFAGVCAQLPTEPEDRILILSGNGAVRCFADAVRALAAGACICVGGALSRPDDVARSIDGMKITALALPPSVARHLSLAVHPSVTSIVLYGEAVRHRDVQGVLAAANGASLFSMYCPSVYPLGLSVVRLDASSSSIATLNSLGRPPNVLVVDDAVPPRPLPLGWLGELCLKRNLGDASRSGQDAGQSLQRTGDMAILSADRGLTFVGKRSLQSQLRGRIVPLIKIESAAQACVEQIVDCKAEICHLPVLERDALVLFIDVGSNPLKPATVELRGRCISEWIHQHVPELRRGLPRKLPHPMLPEVYLPLTCMPRTSHGWVDRAALHQLVSSLTGDSMRVLVSHEQASSSSPLCTEEQQAMAQFWAQIVGISASSLSPTSQWIAVGGDSILAMRLVSLARASGVHMQVAQVLGNRTLSELASAARWSPNSPTGPVPARADESEASGASAAASQRRLDAAGVTPALLQQIARYVRIPPDAVKDAIEDVGEATDFQTTMFCSGMLTERGWNNHLIVDFAADTGSDTVEQACAALVAAHPILRTAFVPIQQILKLVTLSRGRLALQRVHIADGDADVATTTARWIAQDRSTAPSVTEALLRGAIIATGRECRLVLAISHLLYDGISLPTLYKELDRAVAGEQLLGDSGVSFADYARLANASLTPDAQRYWRGLLDQSRMTNIVEHDRPLFEHPMASTCLRSVHLPSTASQYYTLATIVKGAWAHVLSQWAATDDVVFGSLVSGRQFSADQDLSGVVGPCINMLPVRVQFHRRAHDRGSDDEAQALLEQVHDQHIASLSQEAVPYQRLIASCTHWPAWTRFSSAVQHQHLDQEDPRTNLIAAENDSADLWVLTRAQPHPDGSSTLAVELTYCDTVLSADAVDKLASCLCSTLDALLTSSPGSYHSLPDQRHLLASLPALPIQLQRASQPEQQLYHNDEEARQVQQMVYDAWRSVGLDPTDTAIPFYDSYCSILPAVELSRIFTESSGKTVLVEELVSSGTVSGHTRLILSKSAHE